MTSNPKSRLTQEMFGSAIADLDKLSTKFSCPLYLLPLDESPSETGMPGAQIIAVYGIRPEPADPPEEKWVEVFGYTSDQELGYWAAYHEFAHLTLGHLNTKADSDNYQDNLVQHEAEAWCWCIDNSPYVFGERAVKAMDKWFNTYLANNDWESSEEILYLASGGWYGD
jgi:hypothetical protein